MKKIITVTLFIGVIGGIIGTLCYSEPKIEYVKEVVEPPSLNEIITQRAIDIMATAEFQEEIRAMATARALYQLSIEKQDVAVELSEMAMASYKKSVDLSSKWTVQ